MATPLQQDGMRNTQLCGACAAETRLNKKQQGFYLSGRSMTRNTSRRSTGVYFSFLSTQWNVFCCLLQSLLCSLPAASRWTTGVYFSFLSTQCNFVPSLEKIQQPLKSISNTVGRHFNLYIYVSQHKQDEASNVNIQRSLHMLHACVVLFLSKVARAD